MLVSGRGWGQKVRSQIVVGRGGVGAEYVLVNERADKVGQC